MLGRLCVTAQTGAMRAGVAAQHVRAARLWGLAAFKAEAGAALRCATRLKQRDHTRLHSAYKVAPRGGSLLLVCAD